MAELVGQARNMYGMTLLLSVANFFFFYHLKVQVSINRKDSDKLKTTKFFDAFLSLKSYLSTLKPIIVQANRSEMPGWWTVVFI